MPQLYAIPNHIYVFAVIILFLTLVFLLFFFFPGLWLRLKLGRLLRQVRSTKDRGGEDRAASFANDRTFAHLWQEYSETLHEQKENNPNTGLQDIVVFRSTVPAEAFFNASALVDTRLRTEFFKHLPGIFTGIGIIGTFYGLILGLQAFQVSENATAVRESLNKLLHGVWEAFLVSAVAIGLAMLVTFAEKLLLASLYRKVEELAQIIDSLFESGAGEEYLSRLVKASEDGASQTKILKDALVKDLKEILTELAEKQIAAAATGSAQLGQQIAGGLETSLKEPLDKIATAVNQVGQDQGTAVTKLLTDVLSGFSQRLQELFGDQIGGINQMQQQTVQALQAAVSKLEQMASGIEAAGRNATDAMAARLTEAIDGLEARQRAMNEQMAEFVAQIRSLVQESQSETGQKLQMLLGDLGIQVTDMVTALREQANRSADTQIEREKRVAEHTNQTISQLGGQIDSVLAQVISAASEMRASVEAMRGATTEAVTKMNSGAETLYLAASEFAKAGEAMSGVLTQATNVANQLAQAAGNVATATRSLGDVIVDYKAARDIISQLVSTLQATVEAARKDAALTSDILQRIEGATTKLVDAQREADQYLERVSMVLAEAHQDFADNMSRTVGQANTQFYSSLTKATGLLRDGIQELEATLGARR